MEFVISKDIEAPQDFVFHEMCAFATFERQALRGGIDVVRTSGEGAVGMGTSWRLKFEYRNMPWVIDARIDTFESPSGYGLTGVSKGLDGRAAIDLMPLSQSATRLVLTIELIPRTFGNRILVQSLRLVRGRIEDAVKTRMSSLAHDTQEKWRATS